MTRIQLAALAVFAAAFSALAVFTVNLMLWSVGLITD
jgi:hypothetical protein